MRWTWLVGLIATAGCDNSFRQVGPGDPRTSTTGTTSGDDDDGGTAGEGSRNSCDRRAAQGICEEYVGSGWDEVSIASDCGGADDELLTTSCPISDIGGCDETRENPQGTVVWYYQGDFYTSSDAGFLESDCVTSYYTWLPY